MAQRASNAGLRIFHQGQPDEQRIKGNWPALISEKDWERVVDLFAAPERRRTRPASRVHLLTYGVGVCGVCGGPLRMARRSGEPMYYVCTTREECVGRVQKYVDRYVADTVIEWLSRRCGAVVGARRDRPGRRPPPGGQGP